MEVSETVVEMGNLLDEPYMFYVLWYHLHFKVIGTNYFCVADIPDESKLDNV